MWCLFPCSEIESCTVHLNARKTHAVSIDLGDAAVYVVNGYCCLWNCNWCLCDTYEAQWAKMLGCAVCDTAALPKKETRRKAMLHMIHFFKTSHAEALQAITRSYCWQWEWELCKSCWKTLRRSRSMRIMSCCNFLTFSCKSCRSSSVKSVCGALFATGTC